MTDMHSVGERRRAREIALHIVYERSFDADSLDSILDRRLSEDSFHALSPDIPAYENELPAAECVYLRTLILGIDEKKPELDEIIRKYSLNWKLERISRVSRAILEIALYEILEMKDIDVSVSINEAVELAKTYESEDAGAFVNGVLGGYVRSGN